MTGVQTCALPICNTTAIRVTDENGKVKYIRNADAVLEIEIQKELAENTQLETITPEELTKEANENDIKPEVKAVEPGKEGTEQVQKGRPAEVAETPEGEKVKTAGEVVAEAKPEAKPEAPKTKRESMLDELHAEMGTKPEAKPTEAKPTEEKPAEPEAPKTKRESMLDELQIGRAHV